MESDDKTAKGTTLGRLIKPLLGRTMYTTPRPFSHIYLVSIKRAPPANKLNARTDAHTPPTNIIIKVIGQRSEAERQICAAPRQDVIVKDMVMLSSSTTLTRTSSFHS